MTCFQDTAELILGQNAAFLGELKEKVSQLACIFIVCLEVELCFIHLVLGCPQISGGFVGFIFLILLIRQYSCNVLKAALSRM